jgi:hypothetical protein
MMRRRYVILIGVLWLSHGAFARAADHPVLAPTREVEVTYKLTGANQQNGAQILRVTYADQGRVRLDFFHFATETSAFASLIFDPPANRVITLLPERQGYLQRDVGKLVNPGSPLTDKMNFTRQTSVTIAGLQCVDWSVTNGAAGEGTACVTADGVVLRATRSKPVAGSMEALTVKYTPTSPDLFTPPPNYQLIPSAPVGQSPLPAAPPPH